MECSCDDIRALIREELERVMAKGGAKGSAGGRKKRNPSGYNIFMGECRKTGKDMKGCAVDYRGLSQQQKDALKARAAAGRPPDPAERMLKRVI